MRFKKVFEKENPKNNVTVFVSMSDIPEYRNPIKLNRLHRTCIGEKAEAISELCARFENCFQLDVELLTNDTISALTKMENVNDAISLIGKKISKAEKSEWLYHLFINAAKQIV